MLLLSAAQAATESLNIDSLIGDLAFILILGAVTTIIFKLLKQPVVLGYIVAGFLASPNFEYLPSVTDESNIILSPQKAVGVEACIKVFTIFSRKSVSFFIRL